jgi:fluoride ion exporter CrcB/FEX
MSTFAESFLIFCAIGAGSYIGGLMRVGISYYRIWKVETNYTVMYVQIVGCLIMGFYLYFKPVMFANPKSRFDKVHYIAITTGLCGSITTFSTWMMECNKNFYLQWDLSWGNIAGSYNGGRFLEWIISMWVGVALPIAALRLGKALGEWYDAKWTTTTFQRAKFAPIFNLENLPWRAPREVQEEIRRQPKTEMVPADHEQDPLEYDGTEFVTNVLHQEKPKDNNSEISLSLAEQEELEAKDPANHFLYFWTDYNFSEWMLIGFFFISTILLMFIPFFGFPTWDFFTYTAFFGVIGASLRYQFAFWNPTYPNFPMGTFTANILGTYLLAAFTLLSKFFVEYYDLEMQAILFGLSTGFCGCLTTVSTFVAELDSLPTFHSCQYGIATNFIAQLGIIFILNIYSFKSVNPSIIMPPAINQCDVTQSLCNDLLTKLACPTKYWNNLACLDHRDYNSYIGNCSCGLFPGDRVIELMIDSQVKLNSTNNLVAVWPTEANTIQDPTQTFDYCLSYQNLCSFFFDRIHCPMTLRQLNACNDRQGVYSAQNLCTCGGNDVSGDRISELLADAVLFRRFDLMPYNGYITLLPKTVDYCSAFVNTCNSMLDHIQCPLAIRVSRACSVDKDYRTWDALCSCEQYDSTQRIAEDVFDSIMKPNMQPLVTQPNPSLAIWEPCSSYYNICQKFLDFIGCAASLRVVKTCGNPTSEFPYGQLQYYNGVCSCGTMQMLYDRVRESIIDSVTAEFLNTNYLYIPPAQAPYTLTVSSNPYKQLLYPTTPNNIIPA